jgi:hypothetical protein
LATAINNLERWHTVALDAAFSVLASIQFVHRQVDRAAHHRRAKKTCDEVRIVIFWILAIVPAMAFANN